MNETIVAIATPIGISGIGVVRLSGPQALAVAQKLWRPAGNTAKVTPRYFHLGWLVERNQKLDQAMLVFMPGPRSFTGEDVVELQTHGAPPILDWVVGQATEHGARLAEPGEFTKRAYFNRKIDLTQAEAVNDLIHAQSLAAARAASDQLAGGLRSSIEAIRAQLISLSAAETAFLDFGDEDIEPTPAGEVASQLKLIVDHIDELVRDIHTTALVREGVKVAIIGLPNAGKSTLLNRLLRYDRSIVTAVAGTTRDVIEERIMLGPFPVRLVDTAGLNEAPDAIEAIGIERTRQAVQSAALVLLLVAPDTYTRTARFLRQQALTPPVINPDNTIVVLTKNDLSSVQTRSPMDGFESVPISAQTGAGIAALKKLLGRKISSLSGSEETAGFSAKRQLGLLRSARQSLQSAARTLRDGQPRDIMLAALDEAIDSLNELAGEDVSRAKIEAMFANFCIGK